MSSLYGPLEYLSAFAMVLAAGLLLGFGLGWHFCSHFRNDPLQGRF